MLGQTQCSQYQFMELWLQGPRKMHYQLNTGGKRIRKFFRYQKSKSLRPQWPMIITWASINGKCNAWKKMSKKNFK